MDIQTQIVLPVVVSAGNMKVLTSGTANFNPKDNLRIQIGAITVEFVFQERENEKPEILRNPVPESLVFRYLIKGLVPGLPAGIGLKYPDVIGTAQGLQIYLSFGLSSLAGDQDAMSLQYTVYTGVEAPKAPSVAKEVSNG